MRNAVRTRPTTCSILSHRQPLCSDCGLHDLLGQELRSLSFHAFEVCVRDLLRAMGYTEVQMLDRTAWRQRTSHGGRDLEAYSQTGLTRARIILQLKQYERPVSRRFVDELRGTMLRTGARQGLVITTSSFSRAARNAATGDHYAAVAPIRLIDGAELCGLLVQHRVGVWEERQEPSDGASADPTATMGLDTDYFEALRRAYPGSEKEAGRPRTRGEEGTPPTGLNGGRAALPEPASTPKTNDNFTDKGGLMTWRTHVLAGISALWLLKLVPGALSPDNMAVLAVCASLGALLPDLDATESKLRSLSVAGIQPVAPLSDLVHRAWGHRGFLHSAAGLCSVAALCAGLSAVGWLSLLAISALVLGYASHLVMDGCTRSGIPLLYPSKRRVHLLPKALRLRTGSSAEEVVLALLLVPALLLLLGSIVAPHSGL